MAVVEFVDAEGLGLLVDAIDGEPFDIVDTRMDGVGLVEVTVVEGECLVGLLESEGIAGHGDEFVLHGPEHLVLHEVVCSAGSKRVDGDEFPVAVKVSVPGSLSLVT